MASLKLCITLFLLATAVSAACAARTMPAATENESGFNDQKNFVSYGGIGGMNGIGSGGLPYGGFASGTGAGGDFGGAGLGGGFGGGSGLGGESSLPTLGGTSGGLDGGVGGEADDLSLP
ncbi:unnamed protein product [Cuscuta epithymum]|uniref:Glycine-rich protein n=1 Tax=Cuscuta epithymum TaxID=186058 RepID=A0AAV0E0T0_9ASTE|nr:unnamed protein product [Cuscuta epithymum]